MKTNMFYIIVTAHEAVTDCQVVAWLPQYITAEALHLMLKAQLKKGYKVKVYKDKPKHFNNPVPRSFCSMETLVEFVQSATLHRKVVVKKLIPTEEVVETRKFKLSYLFKVDQVVFNDCCAYVSEGITFFFIKKTIEAKDIAFIDDDLCETLGCKLATSGAYYLHGEWKFFRSKTTPVQWEARKIERGLRVDIIDEYLEEI